MTFYFYPIYRNIINEYGLLLRLYDDAFIRLCFMINDNSIAVRAMAASLLVFLRIMNI